MGMGPFSPSPASSARRGTIVTARRAAVKRYASDAVGLARRKDIGASAALSFAASRLWINTTMLALDDAALASHLYRRLCGRETLASALKDLAERIDRRPGASSATAPGRRRRARGNAVVRTS
jgi:hypothetical protein